MYGETFYGRHTTLMTFIDQEVAHACKEWVFNRMKVLKAYSGMQVVSLLPLPSFCPSPLPFSPLSVSSLSLPLYRPPSILATPSYINYPRAVIIQQRPQQSNIFVRMIRDTMPYDGISTIKGLQTVLTLAMLVADVLLKLEQTTTPVQSKIIRRRLAIKIKPLLFDITNSSFWYHKSYFVTSTNNLWCCDIAKLILCYQKLIL